MAILSFKEKFADKVEQGKKRQTIRNFRKVPILPFEQLYLYFGARTKWCRKLGEGQCTAVHPITITREAVTIHQMINVRITNQKDLDRFARADGFASYAQMIKWWTLTHGPKCFPFRGIIIYWTFLSKKNWIKPGSPEHKALRKKIKVQFD
jgi:hypothetical protein